MQGSIMVMIPLRPGYLLNLSSDNTIDETWVSAESEFNNTSGDLMETSQSCVVTGSIPIPIFSELHHIFLTSER